MKSIRVRPVPAADPTFVSPGAAIEWQSDRNREAIRDSVRLRDGIIEGVWFDDQNVKLFIAAHGSVNMIWLRCGSTGTVWSVHDVEEPWEKGLRRGGETREVLELKWDHGSGAWTRSADLALLLDKTIAGLRASNEYIWLYPMRAAPLAFCDIVDCDRQQRLLFWRWD